MNSSQMSGTDQQTLTTPKIAVLASHPYRSLEQALGKIFPTTQEETLVHRARRIMGDEVRDLSDEELERSLTEFQYLVHAWLDSFEETVFKGKTLQQALREELV